MSHDNRNRLEVTQPGTPRLYQPADLPGWEFYGEVSRGDDRGALVRHRRSGEFCMARAGALTQLDQRKIKSALGIRPGHPVKVPGGKRRNVFMDDESWEKAKRLGGGKASEGIRRAIEQASGD